MIHMIAESGGVPTKLIAMVVFGIAVGGGLIAAFFADEHSRLVKKILLYIGLGFLIVTAVLFNLLLMGYLEDSNGRIEDSVFGAALVTCAIIAGVSLLVSAGMQGLEIHDKKQREQRKKRREARSKSG